MGQDGEEVLFADGEGAADLAEAEGGEVFCGYD